METIEVNKKQLVAEYNNATESGRSILTRLFGEKFFSNKITDRVKSLDDVYTIKGTTYEDLIRIYPEDVISFKQATLITEVLNEGWKPNWDNSNEYKYYPWFDMRSKSGFGFSRSVSARSKRCSKRPGFLRPRPMKRCMARPPFWGA